ncbi:hypothetical protein [Aeromonas caviae]|uniref:hypothetical protein n=1 Tax=Aeromonas caviae TaxID=648 RepID=UPI00385EEBBA
MVRMVTALVAASLLSGCDLMDEVHAYVGSISKNLVVEYDSGYMVRVDDQTVPIYGTDVCVSDDSRRDCVVIKPDTKMVVVIVGFPNRPQKESWVVKRYGQKVELARADGTRIYQGD